MRNKVIRISKIENNQVLRETLMHEILHACVEDEDISPELEERIVRRLSPNLMQVLGKKEIRDFLFKEGEWTGIERRIMEVFNIKEGTRKEEGYLQILDYHEKDGKALEKM